MPFQDVWFEILFDEVEQVMLVLAEIGVPKPEHRAEVAEGLLLAQMMHFRNTTLRFGFNPHRQAPVLLINVPIDDELGPEKLVDVFRNSVGQIEKWRESILGGLLMKSESTGIGPLSSHDGVDHNALMG